MTKFTKEQLIEQAQEDADTWRAAAEQFSPHPAQRQYAAIRLRVAEIALAALTAPDYIPPHVEDAMGDMCDGGFNAQGIWDLCRESIMPPEPCLRCGTVSDRPDGAHYCHKGKK
ncbi:hypothetical protein ICF92_003247 [Escherichia coli]|nr:hypothetical protein [Escherichia coli]